MKHTFRMEDDFQDQRNDTPHSTYLNMSFTAETLDDLVNEFTNYLWHCGYTYVEEVEVKTKTFRGE